MGICKIETQFLCHGNSLWNVLIIPILKTPQNKVKPKPEMIDLVPACTSETSCVPGIQCSFQNPAPPPLCLSTMSGSLRTSSRRRVAWRLPHLKPRELTLEKYLKHGSTQLLQAPKPSPGTIPKERNIGTNWMTLKTAQGAMRIEVTLSKDSEFEA